MLLVNAYRIFHFCALHCVQEVGCDAESHSAACGTECVGGETMCDNSECIIVSARKFEPLLPSNRVDM